MQTINFVTSNEVKLKEVQNVLSPDPNFKLIHHCLELPELQGSLDEIAINKCITAATVIQDTVLVEDTALTFHSLNGLPGPYIKTFMEQLGLQGLIRILADFEDKTAVATSTFAYTKGPNAKVKLFRGTMQGKIIQPSSALIGTTSWKSIFQPTGYNMPYSLMVSEEKNKISHRYKALMGLVAYLKETYKSLEHLCK